MLNLAALFVYFIDIYYNYTVILNIVFGLYTVYLALLVAAWGIHNIEYNYDIAQEYKNKFLQLIKKKFYIITVILLILSPSVKTIYISSGLILGQQAINKAENSELLNKAYKVLELQMDKYLDEILNPKQEDSKSK